MKTSTVLVLSAIVASSDGQQQQQQQQQHQQLRGLRKLDKHSFPKKEYSCPEPVPSNGARCGGDVPPEGCGYNYGVVFGCNNQAELSCMPSELAFCKWNGYAMHWKVLNGMEACQNLGIVCDPNLFNPIDYLPSENNDIPPPPPENNDIPPPPAEDDDIGTSNPTPENPGRDCDDWDD